MLCVLSSLPVFADCTFNITNYSDSQLGVEAGFYGGNSVTVDIDVASSKTVKVKNTLSCNAMSPVGFGVTYVNLVGKQSSGGWVYAPGSKMIRGVGRSSGSQDMVVGTSPNGGGLILFNNNNPSADSFDVRVEKASRNVSRQLGSMN